MSDVTDWDCCDEHETIFLRHGQCQYCTIETLQARVAELEGIMKAHQIRPQGKSWSADMYLLQAENKRLDAALLRVRSMICANSRAVETLKVIDKARTGE